MNGVKAIQTALMGTQFVLNRFLEGLSDADILTRPVPGANHVAWQLGHLINSECYFARQAIPDIQLPELPPNFAQWHDNKNTSDDDPSHFLSKEVYADLFNKVRKAVIAAVGQLTDEELDRPTQGPMAPFAPTIGALLLLASNHTLMHGGQFSVLRRKLGKPVAF